TPCGRSQPRMVVAATTSSCGRHSLQWKSSASDSSDARARKLCTTSGGNVSTVRSRGSHSTTEGSTAFSEQPLSTGRERRLWWPRSFSTCPMSAARGISSAAPAMVAASKS
ncbi:unnamed protein product, partial [Symbiodinium pilosum]